MIFSPTKNISEQCETRFGGIHLAGPNAKRTAFITALGNIQTSPLKLRGLYEKIGTMGKVFSDDHLIEIIGKETPLDGTMIDCPLTVPPCVACVRETCPGVRACEDVSVAYILSLTERLPKNPSRKRRPINPQSQRVWDVQRLLSHHDQPFEPSYSANQAPLVARALTLQKRIKAQFPSLPLAETSPQLALDIIGERLGISTKWTRGYRNFENGKKARINILKGLQEHGWLAKDPETNQILNDAHKSAETFHAVLCAMLASMAHHKLCDLPPENYDSRLGWVYLPAAPSPDHLNDHPAKMN